MVRHKDSNLKALYQEVLRLLTQFKESMFETCYLNTMFAVLSLLKIQCEDSAHLALPKGEVFHLVFNTNNIAVAGAVMLRLNFVRGAIIDYMNFEFVSDHEGGITFLFHNNEITIQTATHSMQKSSETCISITHFVAVNK